MAIVGCLRQDDMVMDMLTVRENVLFSARLRLPNTIGAKVREEKVDEILLELGLKNCANTRVCVNLKSLWSMLTLVF